MSVALKELLIARNMMNAQLERLNRAIDAAIKEMRDDDMRINESQYTLEEMIEKINEEY